MMQPADMIKEWRRGCSCAEINDRGECEHPEECQECTRALIEAIDNWHKQKLWKKVWLLSRLRHWLLRCMVCQVVRIWWQAKINERTLG